MPLPVIPDTMRVAVHMTATGILDEVVNVLHFFNTNGSGPNALDAAFQPAWHTAISQEVQSLFLPDKVTYTQLDGSASIDLPWTAGAMTNPSAAFPMNAAIVWGWRTLLAGRQHRGRSFIGPTGPNRLSTTQPDEWDPTAVINMTTRGNNFINTMISAGFALQVASYTHGTSIDVDHVKINPKVCTQRRRVNLK